MSLNASINWRQTTLITQDDRFERAGKKNLPVRHWLCSNIRSGPLEPAKRLIHHMMLLGSVCACVCVGGEIFDLLAHKTPNIHMVFTFTFSNAETSGWISCQPAALMWEASFRCALQRWSSHAGRPWEDDQAGASCWSHVNPRKSLVQRRFSSLPTTLTIRRGKEAQVWFPVWKIRLPALSDERRPHPSKRTDLLCSDRDSPMQSPISPAPNGRQKAIFKGGGESVHQRW